MLIIIFIEIYIKVQYARCSNHGNDRKVNGINSPNSIPQSFSPSLSLSQLIFSHFPICDLLLRKIKAKNYIQFVFDVGQVK